MDETLDRFKELMDRVLTTPTNYKVFMDRMNPELLALLLSENRCTNSCIVCSEMKPYDKPGNKPCDMNCQKHVLDWLHSEYSEETFERALRFMYVPKEENE